MKTILFTGMLAAVSLCGNAEESVLFQTDFNNVSERAKLQNPANSVKILNGVLEINNATGGFSGFNIPVTSDTPIQVSFKIREPEKPFKDCHWGITFTGADGQSAQIYSRGKGVEALLQKNKKNTVLRGISNLPVMEKKADAKWTAFRMSVRKGRVEVNTDKRHLGSVTVPLLPLKKISFYAYNNHIQMDDLCVKRLPESEPVKPKQLIFDASFDGSADAKGENNTVIKPKTAVNLRFTEGISGKAVSLEKHKASPTPLKLDPGWIAENGTLRTKTANGMPHIRLNLPDLNEVALSLRFRRDSSPKKDQHFGIFIHGAKGNSLRFFLHADVWTYILTENGRQKAFKDFSKVLPAPAISEKTPMTQCRFELKNGVFTATVGDKTLKIDGVSFKPIRQIAIYNYLLASTVDDLSVTGNNYRFSENFDHFKTAGGNGKLIYESDKLFSDSGAVMFWVRPNWDARTTKTTYPLFRAFGNDKKAKINLFLWTWLRCDIGLKENMNPVAFNRFGRETWFRGDWRHLAVTWNPEGNIRFYLDSLPYLPANNWAGNGKQLSNADIESVIQILLDHSADASFDDLKIYKGNVTPGDVWSEYRKYMPVDLVMQRAILDSSRNDEVAVQIAPAGFYMHPMPVTGKPVPGNVHLKVELLKADGTVLKSGEKQINADHPQEFRLPAGRLDASADYRVRCTVTGTNGKFQRTFFLKAAEPAKAHPATDRDIQIGKLLFSKKLNSPQDPALLSAGKLTTGKEYLEAGHFKGNRFAFEIPFADEYRLKSRPVLLEITWPDDKPRMMGLYMYKMTGASQHRDRLQGGVQSGNEYPLSGKMVKTHYLFYPGTERYLFEARTMANNFPAAVSEVKVYEITGNLPNLKLNLPKTLPGRPFGMVDEDQTTETNLDFDNPSVTGSRMRTVLLTDLMLNYFDYTGQNMFQSPMLRYGWVNYHSEGNPGSGMYPGKCGELPYMVEAFGKRGKQIVGIVNFSNLPEAKNAGYVESDLEKKGMYLRDRNGEYVKSFAAGNTLNIAHPEVRELYCRHLDELLKLFAKSPNFDGLEIWMDSFGTWKKLENGYDDYTLGKFSNETGIRLPEKQRFEFLTGAKRTEWISWRARQVTDFIRKIRERMNRYNPALKLYLAFAECSENLKEERKTNAGIDFDVLKTIPGVYPIPMRYNTEYRWTFHWGRPETDSDEILYNKNKKPFLVNGAVEMTVSYPSYFETFEKSLNNKKFASYFQNADVKPHGRYFLKELTFNVAAFDAQSIGIGAQPLGTWGRDAESREFARAYRALPRKPFVSVPGAADPVTVRYLNTEEGTFFYLASMLFTDCSVALKFSAPCTLTDLSTGKTVSGTSFKLLPYQLRSFLASSKNVRILSASVTVPEKTKSFYRDKTAALKKTAAMMESRNLRMDDEQKTLARIDKAMAKGEYAEVHRLAFSRTMNQLQLKEKNLKHLLRQEAMIRKGHIAVNCGDTQYYAAPNGQFFFPDRPYSDSACYGYFGKYNSVGRSIDRLKEKNIPLIYRSEAYDIDGYRFKVPNGTYKVRLYMKIGWPADFRKDRVLVTVLAQGKPLFENKDFYEASAGDFWKPFQFEADNIEVENGMLEIRFEAKKGLPPNFRLCNAIEIQKEK